MTRNIVATLILILSINVVFSQNITDKNGLKQGKWSNQYESGRLQYKGEFKDGIEVGLFTFYYHSGEVKATKEFFHQEWFWLILRHYQVALYSAQKYSTEFLIFYLL